MIVIYLVNAELITKIAKIISYACCKSFLVSLLPHFIRVEFPKATVLIW